MVNIDISNFRAAYLAALFRFVSLCCLVVVAGCGPPGNEDETNAASTLVIETDGGPRSFTIEVARTNEEKARGLMFRTRLEAGHGMLFPHDEPRSVSMWMRNTYIPLDMLFIASDGRVHNIVARAEPHSEEILSSEGLVTGVLEIGGGEAARLGIRKGDLVRHPHFGTVNGDR